MKDTGLIPGSGRSPGERNGNPLQYSCLGDPMDWGARQATVHGVTKNQTWLKQLSTRAHETADGPTTVLHSQRTSLSLSTSWAKCVHLSPWQSALGSAGSLITEVRSNTSSHSLYSILISFHVLLAASRLPLITPHVTVHLLRINPENRSHILQQKTSVVRDKFASFLLVWMIERMKRLSNPIHNSPKKTTVFPM